LTFLKRISPVGESGSDEVPADAQPVGTAGGRVGPYQLQRQLGAGGHAVQYDDGGTLPPIG
jgi:hypothetical protein